MTTGPSIQHAASIMHRTIENEWEHDIRQQIQGVCTLIHNSFPWSHINQDFSSSQCFTLGQTSKTVLEFRAFTYPLHPSIHATLLGFWIQSDLSLAEETHYIGHLLVTSWQLITVTTCRADCNGNWCDVWSCWIDRQSAGDADHFCQAETVKCCGDP